MSNRIHMRRIARGALPAFLLTLLTSSIAALASAQAAPQIVCTPDSHGVVTCSDDTGLRIDAQGHDLAQSSSPAPLQPAAITPSSASVLHVSQGQSIQAAISQAIPGATILVAPGTYVENLDFLGKAITVESESGPAVTVIDGGANGTVVSFRSGEGRDSVLQGFTLRNGFGGLTFPYYDAGGGVWVYGTSPTVLDNIIEDNLACVGAGISVEFGSPLIQGNVIQRNRQAGCSGGTGGGGIAVGGASSAEIIQNVIAENVTGSFGGGISLFAAGTPTIEGNIIRDNRASQGGAINMYNFSDALIVQNLVTGNHGYPGAGVYWLVPSGERGPLLVNNTITDNAGPGVFADGYDKETVLIGNIIAGNGSPFFCGSFNDLNPPQLSFDDVYSEDGGAAYGGICTDQTGVNGNLSADPMFVDEGSGDYHLEAGSPAIDAGDNNAPDLPAQDLDGNARIYDGNGDGTATVDMGVYELTNAPPDCSLGTANPGELWPPNHQLATIDVVGVTDPDGDPVSITITGVKQDEPTVGEGDGDTSPDADGVGTSAARVRAERSGSGDGRVYHIGFKAEDGRGGTCTGTVTVCVPHDQGQGAGCADGGALFDSTVGGGS